MNGSRFLLGAVAQLSSRGVMLASGFVQFLYLSRTLGPEGYGLYSVAFSLNLLVFSVVDPALTSGLVTMLGGDSRGRAFARTSARLVLGVGLLLVLVAWGVAPWVARFLQTPELVGPLRCLAPALLLQLLSMHSSQCLVGEGRWYAPASSLSLMWLTRLAVGWVLVENGWGAMGAAAAVPVSLLLQFLTNQLQGAHWVWQPGAMLLRDWWSHSRHLMAGSMLHNLVYGMDLPVLKRFVSATEAGQYAAAQNLGLPVQSLCLSLLPMLQQRLAKTRNEEPTEQLTRLCGLVIRLWLCLAVGIGALSVLGSDLGRLLFGPRYDQSGRIGEILLVELGFRCVLWPQFTILAAQQERHRVSRIYSWAAPPLLLMYAVVLTVGSRLGLDQQPNRLLLLCAGLGIVRTGVLAWLMMAQVRQVVSVPFPWRTLGRALVAGGVAAAVATRLPGDGWAVLSQVVVLVGTYAGLLLLWGESLDRPTRTRGGLGWPEQETNLAEEEPGLV
jgi:O-antigen/teichoic acid export membrane protein